MVPVFTCMVIKMCMKLLSDYYLNLGTNGKNGDKVERRQIFLCSSFRIYNFHKHVKTFHFQKMKK